MSHLLQPRASRWFHLENTSPTSGSCQITELSGLGISLAGISTASVTASSMASSRRRVFNLPVMIRDLLSVEPGAVKLNARSLMRSCKKTKELCRCLVFSFVFISSFCAAASPPPPPHHKPSLGKLLLHHLPLLHLLCLHLLLLLLFLVPSSCCSSTKTFVCFCALTLP